MSRIRLMDWKYLVVCALALGICLFRPTDVVAQVPSTPVDIINFLGGMENQGLLPGGGPTDVLTVPSNRKFLLTDLIFSNGPSETVVGCVRVLENTGPNQGDAGDPRVEVIRVPIGETVSIGFLTGVGFPEDTVVTLRNCAGADLFYTMRGYAFTINP